MDSMWNAFKTPQLRWLGAAIAITGAATVIAGGVVLGERPQDDRPLPLIAPSDLSWPDGATRNDGAAVVLPIDGSVPDAAAALQGVATGTTEMPATF